jgi:predicted HicB family RNase H-like nuclease
VYTTLKEKKVYTPQKEMTKKTRVITGRVKTEIAERLEAEAEREGVSRSEIIEKALEGYGKQTNYPEGVKGMLDDMEFMARFYDKTLEDFARDVIEAIENEEITYNGKLGLNPRENIDIKDFLRACEEKDIEPQKKLEELTKSIWNMRTGGAGGA